VEYRKKESFKVITFPSGFVEEQRQLVECCDEFLVLASESSTDSWKNDSELVSEKKADGSDDVTFEITRCGSTDVLDNLGEVFPLPNDPLVLAFRYDWAQYLGTYGSGVYVINVVFNIAGIIGRYEWGRFRLMPYRLDTAEYTARIKTVFDSLSLASTIDWTGSGAYGTIRFKGKFWDAKPNTIVRSPVDKGFVVRKTTTENLNSYTLDVDASKYSITRRVLDFHVRDGSEHFVSDYNSINHRYDYQDYPVALSDQDSIDKSEVGRLGIIKIPFMDRVKKQKSIFNR
jgi:hypothetical protein